jgi:ribosomal protein S12 methylthiotransferase
LERELAAAGHLRVPPPDADLLIVNTCGFIDAAKEESIDALLAAADDAHARGARVAAVGCLVARYHEELPRELPEIDVFCGFEREPLLAELAALAAGVLAGRPPREGAARRRLPRPLHAYVKISDGCDRSCAYCAIPLIKGTSQVISPDEVVALAGRALADGAREVTLVGQDTSRWSWRGYGALPRLLADLSALRPFWLRVLYLQPDGLEEALLEALARYAVPYVDLPLQHASGRVLRRMGRTGDGASYLELLRRVRAALPGAAVRSTFISGFPGETEADVDALLDFVAEAGLAVAGVFVFDPQEGTRAWSMRPRVPRVIAEERAARVADAIERAAQGFWNGLVGQTVDVLVEHGSRGDGQDATGRIAVQASDVDGITYVSARRPVRRGQVVRAVVQSSAGYELSAAVPQQ